MLVDGKDVRSTSQGLLAHNVTEGDGAGRAEAPRDDRWDGRRCGAFEGALETAWNKMSGDGTACILKLMGMLNVVTTFVVTRSAGLGYLC